MQYFENLEKLYRHDSDYCHLFYDIFKILNFMAVNKQISEVKVLLTRREMD